MKTELLKPNDNVIDLASEIIKNGGIVAVPTETVYGIAGSAYDGEAVKKIFIAKGRPQDNPLIVHISSMEMLKDVVSEIPKDAYALAEAFWPGPLTMIMPKSDKVSPVTTAGLQSVGVRMPSHPVAHNIIERSGIPFAAPSANLSGKPSPTNAKDVFADMDGRLPLIIDGGESYAGVESTVVSLLDDTPVILRPGYVTKEQMESVLGKTVSISKNVTEKLDDGEKPLSPGMKYKHYAPNAEITILKGDLDKFIAYVDKITTKDTACMCFTGESEKIKLPCVEYGKEDSPEEQAHNLFTSLRVLDERGYKTVYARCPKTDGVSLAVFNRLIRAAGFRLIEL